MAVRWEGELEGGCRGRVNNFAQLAPRPPSHRPSPKYSISYISKLQAYAALARVHAPVGATLLFLPCLQSTLLAATLLQRTVLGTIALFGTGSFLMRSAGCVINDLWDQDLDRAVERTSMRPLASGALSNTEALGFLSTLLTGGLAVLLQFDVNTIILGMGSMGLVVLYPLMKRITYFPQVVLGLAFNWGALLGFSALSNGAVMGWDAALPLYGSGVLWCILYDTIYAHQDAKDDVNAGIHSTALFLGQAKTKPFLSALAIGQFSLLGSLAVTFPEQLANGPYIAGTTLAALYTANMIYKVDVANVQDCGRWFKRSQYVGWLVAAGLAGEYARQLYLAAQEQESVENVVQ
ncbi:UbiA prenyltransferase family-domain-containing protein [Protomyces lactucae-debilis]|uniref:4-hydroxybenzoate polyprenyltransferase, mitochondrial n=1 Tax=Protomyces lactucae-debilis TaxID=2754530 RepID=A0A1Y2F5G7_PROLT|nr:UbiA prenyltransferase family-domain-containing protein [Protomyces lactucae-debilis]ORY79103.1 UbiA prenyltransferase family-domain-containing protein [Protomyces lactucae-debilis]